MAKLSNDPEYHRLRELLIAARIDAGLTQAEVAERLGRTQSFVSKYENGERGLDVLDFFWLCSALGTEPNFLFQNAITKVTPGNKT